MASATYFDEDLKEEVPVDAVWVVYQTLPRYFKGLKNFHSVHATKESALTMMECIRESSSYNDKSFEVDWTELLDSDRRGV